MLIDIFARRYESTAIFRSFDDRDKRLIVQSFRILSEDLFPYYDDGKEIAYNVEIWTRLHRELSRELGLIELAPQWYSYNIKWNGNDTIQTHKNTMIKICENWMNQPISGSPDVHIKDRISLIELGFRLRENQIATRHSKPVSVIEKTLASLRRADLNLPKDQIQAVHRMREQELSDFRSSVEELNARFTQAGYPINYHNGYIQISNEGLVQKEVESPFWLILSSPIWKNVDHDMKEALDLRDSNGRDPAFYAARALESTIKIISEQKGWTHGKEKGAHNYIDNLASKENSFITPWEAILLKEFFTKIRNPLGHGPGSAEMPVLSREQTQFAIEFAMIWIKYLVVRM
ncbi:AbiJ-NTD4 domain-containing protein [Ancylobacter rudongensis]|uniref:HEPN AbiJ-N-terminal domain-containing protein n=1 Tax=Ancylobacter rudongensis TaxID=177413 RepID=A0A1G4RHR3_9HYPH|nr:hypothetical protein [Ancylobacter rudongensis]SCW56368.1 hypothetical protein SAMN05660859_1660 [Ancylobacter rudongensis]